MNRERFLKLRRKDWQEFEVLLPRLKSTRLSKWNSNDVTELSRKYRSICYDLSMVRSREWGSQLEQYLNDLVADGHNCLYRSPPRSLYAVVEFLTVGFPRLLRARKAFFFVSLGLFAIPFLIAMVVAIVDPASAELVMERMQLEQASDSFAKEIYQETDGRFAAERSAMAGFYVLNNVGIAFRCFALGAFFGLGTVKELLQNGIVLGTVFGYVAQAGHGDNFFSFVISHGSFELTAIVIAGASGLLIGRGMLYPGNLTRVDSLRHHGKDAVQLIVGAGVMLGIAALIEAYFSPMAIPSMIKYIVGTLLWIIIILYLSLAGRGTFSHAS